METKDPKSAESAGGPETAESKDPKSDATSSDTLSDLERTEEVPEADNDQQGGGTTAPSPDGAFDEGRGSDSGVGDAGPM